MSADAPVTVGVVEFVTLTQHCVRVRGRRSEVLIPRAVIHATSEIWGERDGVRQMPGDRGALVVTAAYAAEKGWTT